MKTSESSDLTYKDHDGALRTIDGLSLTVDQLDRHWIWSEQLDHNLVYKTKGRENALLAAINSLLFTIHLKDERINHLQRIANLVEKFVDDVNQDGET